MKQELQEKLFKDFPTIFKLVKIIECDNGWFDLIYKLCEDIINVENNTDRGVEDVIFTQVKEKFGKLRIYYTGGDMQIFGMVDFAETISSSICEQTGEKGELYSNNGLVCTLSPKLVEEYNKKNGREVYKKIDNLYKR